LPEVAANNGATETEIVIQKSITISRHGSLRPTPNEVSRVVADTASPGFGMQAQQ